MCAYYNPDPQMNLEQDREAWNLIQEVRVWMLLIIDLRSLLKADRFLL